MHCVPITFTANIHHVLLHTWSFVRGNYPKDNSMSETRKNFWNDLESIGSDSHSRTFFDKQNARNNFEHISVDNTELDS